MWTQNVSSHFFFPPFLQELCWFKRPFLLIQNEKIPSDSHAISRAFRYRFPLLPGITLFHRLLIENKAGVTELATKLISLFPVNISQLFSQSFLLPPQLRDC